MVKGGVYHIGYFTEIVVLLIPQTAIIASWIPQITASGECDEEEKESIPAVCRRRLKDEMEIWKKRNL